MQTTFQKPIVRLSAQDANIVLDKEFIETNRNKVSYYPQGNTDADYAVLKRQLLMTRINTYAIRDANAVIGTANSLEGDLYDSHDGNIPKELMKAMIKSTLRPTGVSVTVYNPAMYNDDGFVSTYTGTTTVYADTVVKAGDIIAVDLPDRATMYTNKPKGYGVLAISFVT